jgi:2'-5' RNA ligase
VALALPAAVRDELARAIEALRSAVPNAKWVPPENLHLTLAFLGSVEADRIDELAAAIASAIEDNAQISTSVGELGAFPSVRRARVVWAGLDDLTGGLRGLAGKVAGVLEPLGFPRESRAFQPHVTLARLRAPGAIELGAVQVEPLTFSVERVSLFESRLGRPAPVYEELATFPFRRGS